jgi:hypothetical protein
MNPFKQFSFTRKLKTDNKFDTKQLAGQKNPRPIPREMVQTVGI